MRSSLALMLCTILLTGAGCISTTTPSTDGSVPAAVPEPQTTQKAPSITAENQSDEHGLITLGTVTMTFDGWLVAYATDGDKPGKILGNTYLTSGRYLDVTVWLDDTSYTGKVYIVPHHDQGVHETFEFPGPDMPFEINGTVPVESFMIE